MNTNARPMTTAKLAAVLAVFLELPTAWAE